MTDFIRFAESHGLLIDRIESRRWVRTKTVDHPHKRNGAYFFDGEYAHVQNWATMDKPVTWMIDKPMTPFDRNAMNRRIESSREQQFKERQRANREAADKASWIIKQSKFEQHAYLDAHGFPDMRGMVWSTDENINLLVIPMRVAGLLSGVQLIDRDGAKKFLSGQRCANAVHSIGNGGLDVWCEGYCTGLSVFAAIAALKAHCKVHVCFSAGNMCEMAKAAKKGFIVADNDEKSGTGERVAKESGLPYFMPPTPGHDFNDFHKEQGLFRSSQALRKFMQQI